MNAASSSISLVRWLVTTGCFSFALLASAALTADEPQPATDSASTPEQQWILKYQFQPGQQLRYRTSQTVTTNALASGQKKVDESIVDQVRVFTVDQIESDQSARLAMQFEKVRMQVRTNEGEAVIFETGMKPEEIPSIFRQTAERLKGSAAKYHLLTNGRNATPIDLDDKPEAARTKDQEAPSFLMSLPEHPVKVGDTWKETQIAKVRVTKDLKRKIQILQTFRLESVSETGIAKITFNSSIESPVNSPSIMAQLMQSTPKGSLEFDINRGLMIRKEFRFDESVLNALGNNSMLSSHGLFTEELLDTPAITESTEAVSTN